jgi:type I restriction enzyme S subunit
MGDPVARACIVPDTHQRFLMASDGIRLLPDKDRYNTYFIFSAINRPSFRKRAIQLSTGTTRQRIGLSELRTIRINTPSLEEQKKIAYFLSSIDDWVENLTQQKLALEKYKKGIMQKIFSLKIRFKNENGRDFPEWEEKQLDQVTTNYDNDRKPISSENRELGNYPYYGANGIVDYVSGYIFDGDYVLVAEDGVVDTTKYPVYFVSGKFWANNHAHVLQGKKINNSFLYYSLKNIKFMKYITGSAQTKLNGQVLSKIVIKIPDFQEQQKIANFLISIDNLIESKKIQILQAKKWKKGLMQQMFI